MKSILVDDLSRLEVRVHVIGYKTMGESILVTLWDTKRQKAHYTVVIDIFERKDSNKILVNRTFELLDSYGYGKDRKLEMVCWSHPDDDHSRGLDKLLDRYCDGSTRIFVPYFYHDPDFPKVRQNKKDKEFLSKIIDLNSQRKLACNPASVPANEVSGMETLEIFSTQMGMDEKPVEVRIEALSPTASVLSEKVLNRGNLGKNELAIVVVMTIGEEKLVFGSDIMNEDIEYLSARHLKEPIFVKVPHHGSPSSTEFITRCRMNVMDTVACMTQFTKKHLPDPQVVQDYLKRCVRVDFTGENEKFYWGEVIYRFELFNGRRRYYVHHNGDAVRLIS